MFGLGAPKAVVGLDIGSSAIKAVELKVSGKGFRLAAWATEPLPPDSIVDGAIIDGAAVSAAIRRLLDNNKAFKTKDVAASLSGNAVIVKTISVPLMTDEELFASISWEAEQYIPFDIADVNLDYQILNPGTGADGAAMEVLLVAAKKEKIADYTGVIERAGRVPVVLDVDAFALQNAYEANYDLEADQVVVLLNAGASSININILAGGRSLFTRDIALGGNFYTEALQKELELPFESAELAKKGHPPEGIDGAAVAAVLHATTESVLLEIQKTFDFFKATATSDRIDHILLSGGASTVDGFTEALQQRFGVPVDPLPAAAAADNCGRRRSRPAEGWGSMIKINLLGIDRKVVSPAAAVPGSSPRLVIAAGLILGLCLAGLGWRYWEIGEESKRLNSEIATARQATAQAQTVIAQVQQFEQRKLQLQQRVALIEQLRTAQTGPVHMLDQISRALPPTIWLTELKQTKVADEVVITGQCTTPTGLSDFVGNLEASGYFKKSIEIVSSTTEADAKPPGDLVKFEIKAVFQQPGTPATAAAKSGN
jgi:type IV pilus assembly protein PilM